MSTVEFVEIADTPPLLNLSPPEVEALTEELVTYHAEFSSLFYRKEQAHWGYKYLQGLMLPLEHKPIQPMAMALEGGDIQAMQQLIGQGQWADEPLLKHHWGLVEESLGEADGVLIFDGSDFVKKGVHSVGVARQWCGHLGKVDNCQAGVFAAYASRKGYTLLDRRLYLHKEWFQPDHQDLWKACGIPQDTPFQTKPELALEVLEAVVEEGTLRFRWVTCDEAYGADPKFLDGVAGLEKWYMAEVPPITQVWTRLPQTQVPPWSGKGRKPTKARVMPGQPVPVRVDEIAHALPEKKWHLYQIKEGSKGPLMAQFAFLRVFPTRDGLPGSAHWLVLRRTLEDQPELKTYLSNAPLNLPKRERVRLTGMRWPVEAAIKDGRDELGMDHYMTRTWLGWHHHMTLCILAHHFLVRVQARLKKGLQP